MKFIEFDLSAFVSESRTRNLRAVGDEDRSRCGPVAGAKVRQGGFILRERSIHEHSVLLQRITSGCARVRSVRKNRQVSDNHIWPGTSDGGELLVRGAVPARNR